jgi:phosphate:Na+ symporter
VTNKVFDPSPTELAQMKAQRHSLSIALSRLREYFAQMNTQEMQKKDVKIVSELVDYASNLDAASDIVLRRMVPVALARSQKEVRFSEAGWSELLQAYERMNANMTLAFDLLISEDVEEARQLFLEKDDFVKSQSRSKKRHFARVRNGDETSLASSSQHLETLAALRDFNRMIVSLADPILLRNGQLLETRLVFKSET